MTPQPRHVLHVMNGASGGAAHSTMAIVKVLAEQGIQSSAVCHAMGAAADREAVRETFHGRVRFVPLYWWNRKIRARAWKRPAIELLQLVRTGATLRSARSVRDAVRDFGADLIHTNTLTTPEGGLAALWLGVPHVWHVRELVGPRGLFRFTVEGRPLGCVVERLSSCVIANSEVTAAEIQPWLRRPVRMIPNAIDAERFSAAVPSSAGSTRGSKPVVMMVGNLSSRMKEHALVLRVAARLRDEADFRIVGALPPIGEDPYADGIRKLRRQLDLEQTVALVGPVDDIRVEISRADLLLHPSPRESFGRVAIEAMAASLPVVGVASGGIGEVVDDEVTGLLSAPDDVDGLVCSVRRLLESNSLRRKLGEAGRHKAVEQYSLKAFGRKLTEAYTEAMTRPVSGPTIWKASLRSQREASM